MKVNTINKTKINYYQILIIVQQNQKIPVQLLLNQLIIIKIINKKNIFFIKIVKHFLLKKTMSQNSQSQKPLNSNQNFTNQQILEQITQKYQIQKKNQNQNPNIFQNENINTNVESQNTQLQIQTQNLNQNQNQLLHTQLPQIKEYSSQNQKSNKKVYDKNTPFETKVFKNIKLNDQKGFQTNNNFKKLQSQQNLHDAYGVTPYKSKIFQNNNSSDVQTKKIVQNQKQILKQRMQIYNQKQQYSTQLNPIHAQQSPKASQKVVEKHMMQLYLHDNYVKQSQENQQQNSNRNQFQHLNPYQNQSKFTKLAKYAEQGTLSNSQQKALKSIVQKKPNLAASLDLYAGMSINIVPQKYQNIPASADLYAQPSAQKYSQNEQSFYKDLSQSNQPIIFKQQQSSPQKKVNAQQMKEKILQDIDKIYKARQQLELKKIKNQTQNQFHLMKPVNLNKTSQQFQIAPDNSQFKYYVGNGNNSGLVKRVMQTREHWKEVPNYSNVIHFRWVAVSRFINFQNISNSINGPKRMVNHYQYHQEFTTKSGMVQNLQEYLQNQKQQAFDITPITFYINLSIEAKQWEKDIFQFLSFFLEHQPPNLRNKNDITIKKKNKTVKFPKKQIPEYQKLSEIFQADQNNYIWLLKPVNLNRGRGIEVFKNLQQLEKYLNEYYEGFEEKNFQDIGNQQQTEEILNQHPISEQNPNFKVGRSQSVQQNEKVSQFQQEKTDSNEEIQEKNQNLQDIQETGIENLNTIQDQEKEKQETNVENQINNKPSNVENQEIQIVNQNKYQLQNKSTIVSQKRPQSLSTQITVSQLDPNQAKKNNSQKTFSIENNSQIDLKDKKKQKTKQFLQQYNTQIQQNNQKYLLKESSFVIQKYIEKPMLINKRKFDIRVWTLLTQNMDVYIFKEGYLRTSSEDYTLEDIENPFIHLTNNAVQKFSKNYGNQESGNQLSYKQFQQYIDENNLNYKVSDIIKKMHSSIETAFLSVSKKINKNDKKNCFEIFGFDFLVDENFGCWMIEVNTNPCIEESSPMLQQYLPRMIDDAFKLTIDKIFVKAKPNNQQNQNVINENKKKNNNNQQQNIKKIYNNSQLVDQTIQQQKQNIQQNSSSQLKLPSLTDKQEKEDINLSKENIKLEDNTKLPSIEKNQDQQQLEQQLFKVDGYNDDNMWEFKLNINPFK